MIPADFESLYLSVHGDRPFRWQTRLLEEVLDRGWPPGGLRLPSASGKTSLIDIAVFALALESEKPALERSARLRTFFVIDRRVVVDEAFQHACRLAEALSAPADSVAAEVAARLLQFGGEKPLLTAILRGAMLRDHAWADAPNQPLVCVSTVDQVGSRLLFRGYGVRREQRPVQAAFVALDSLIILDEAHLSQPFAGTIEAVQAHLGKEARSLAAPVQLLRMSATLDNRNGSEVFELRPEEREEAELNRRFSASKLASLEETGSLEEDAAHAALALLKEAPTVAVVVNRVASARSIFERLKATLNGRAEVVLLTGRIREWDRNRLLEKYFPRLRVRRSRESDGHNPLVVVATQTIEVGANLDFDAMVTEAASLDALRQRFGRLDRMGELGRTPLVIVKRKLLEEEESVDPVYGKVVEPTWRWFKQRAGKRNTLDCGTNALDATLDKFPPTKLMLPDPPEAPILLPSHLDALVQTNPEPAPDPEIGPFLHGPEALRAADVHLVWRADLSDANLSQWLDIVSLAPPVTAEALSVPVYAVRQWLAQQAVQPVADLEGVGEVSAVGPRPAATVQRALLWDGPDDSRILVSVDEVGPGCTLVLPGSAGGADEYGWHPESGRRVRDVADWCHNEPSSKRRPRLRLHPEVLKAWLQRDPGDAQQSPADLLHDYLAEQAAEVEDGIALAEVLESLRPVVETEPVLGRSLEALLAAAHHLEVAFYPDFSGVVVRSAAGVEDQTDEADTTCFTCPVSLADHTDHLRDAVRRCAAAIQPPPGIGRDLELAAEYHDLGKADPRFQRFLRGGREPAPGEPLLAKSGMRQNARARNRPRLQSGWPAGGRHEFISLALAQSSRAARARACDWELVQHLIGAHHGFGRAMPPVIPDEHPETISLHWDQELLTAGSDHRVYQLASGWVDRFWQLVDRYGYWGLAFLEGILRRADCVVSRLEKVGFYR